MAQFTDEQTAALAYESFTSSITYPYCISKATAAELRRMIMDDMEELKSQAHQPYNPDHSPPTDTDKLVDLEVKVYHMYLAYLEAVIEHMEELSTEPYDPPAAGMVTLPTEPAATKLNLKIRPIPPKNPS